METTFIQLNHGWNAQPNTPFPTARVEDNSVVLEFFANSYQFPEFHEDQVLCLVFHGAWRYGFGSPNDEGWYLGQCRFSRLAPAWGEFYEVAGDLKDGKCRVKWQYVTDKPVAATRRYLFYFRDETFECDAVSWEKKF